jgi:Glyoxalase/Bleomycin resistance protein/Dioxygenase superfamily
MSAAAPDVLTNPRPVEVLGDLFASIWQICWVTSDFDRGLEVMRDRLGVENITEVPTDAATFLRGDEPVDWKVRIAMGSRGGVIAELIQPVSGEVDYYRRFLPDDGSFGMRLHHLAATVPLGDETWESLRELLASHGLGFDYTVLIPDRVRAGYVDMTAELGHFFEICQLQPADTEFFSGLLAAGD